VKAPALSFEQKMSWILQLEDQRILRVDAPPPPPAPAPVAVPARRGRALPVATPAPPPVPDLTVLVRDDEARIRRRAALAIGRVGLVEGVAPLVTALADADPDVRAMAAFAVGLIGVATSNTQPIVEQAGAALVTALADSVPLVRGRAAEALGQIDAKSAADAIGRMAAEYGRTPAVTAMAADAETWPAPAPEADAFRLALYALVRLHAYEPLASAVLEGGKPVTVWWPVAFALQRIGDPRAADALAQLVQVPGKYTRAFAARGLGGLKDRRAVDTLLALAGSNTTPLEVQIAVIRALALTGDSRAAPALVALLSRPKVDPNVRLESVAALGTLKAADALPFVQDLLTDGWPTMRAAALRAAASIDQETFLLVVASLEPDRDWSVRAALAEVLGTLPAESVSERLHAMLGDDDKRVLPAVLGALARLHAPDAGAAALERLKDTDFAVRSAAARLVGELKPAGGPPALKQALALAQVDSTYDARAAMLTALAEFGAAEALDTVKAALTDKDWAVRLRAVELLAKLDPSADYRLAIRPAPSMPAPAYADPALIAPDYSPHVFIETAKGTVEFELAVLDAPQTSRNMVALIRKGFFNGLQIHRVVPNFVVQAGDPRGDGEGGPGFTIHDELNEQPFVRGSVGIALAWRDTGGSQFFITHSPQPHLDARYTVLGHVVNGMDVVDRIQQGDVIQRMRVWDGKTMQ
jgi:cyclophilin family peptidyl-prolyl cis-trans isomerase/HEAT repeat protein